MIYGGISLSDDLNVPNGELKKIQAGLGDDSFDHYGFEWKGFRGGAFLHPRLPAMGKDLLFIDEEKDILVLCDGYIYNREEMISQLQVETEISTAALICQAYNYWGNHFSNRINGDFAICIYNASHQKITLYRDHLGIRPLVVSVKKGIIFFATDNYGICKALFGQEPVSGSFLVSRFLYDNSVYYALPSDKAIKVKPGHSMQLDKKGIKQEKYWFPERFKENRKLNKTTAIKELDCLLRDAVRIRCDQRFRASSHVSGGLDSGLVAVLARKAFIDQPDFYGFSWTPDSTTGDMAFDFDERSLVYSLCEKNNILPVHSNFTEEDYRDFITNWRYSSELIFEKKITEAAKKNGINLIFSGWGGDEFFSIGQRGIDADLFKKGYWKSYFRRNPFAHPKSLIYSLLFNVLMPDLKRKHTKYKTGSFIYQCLRKVVKNNIIPRKERFSYRSRRGIHLKLLCGYHIAERCEDWYVMGQESGIEYRYPLLDKRIIEYMLRVPSHCLVDGRINRFIVREIGKGLLSENIRAHFSKEDPVRLFYLSQKGSDAEMINELEDYKNNPDLDFIDFGFLEQTIKQQLASSEGNLNPEVSLVLTYIKKVHAFTKAYYN